MTTSPDEKRVDVSVYLVRSSQASIVEQELFPSASCQSLRDDIPGGKFLALPVEATPPKWAAHIETLLADGKEVNLEAQSPGGLLWIPRATKNFVFSFGYAHTKLKEEWFEPDFGKKVALSVIPSGQVVEVRAEQVFAKWHIASERAPRASGVNEFGFEADRDLVSAVEGVPSFKYLKTLGGKVRGGAAFKFSVTFSNLLGSLDIVAERFDSGEYKINFPQVDNLIVVRDQTQIEALDNELNTILVGSKPHEKIALAAPAAKNGDKPYPQHYVIGRMGKKSATAPYLMFGSWEFHLNGRNKTLSLESARNTVVHLLDENEEKLDSCSMYQCFGTEVSLNGTPFVLSSGIWYEAKLQFVNETNTLIQSLTAALYPLPNWDQIVDEGAYNEKVAASDSSLWLFDKKLVHFGGAQSKFEFCDLMHLQTKTLYFVKQPSASASVSHLCEQVRRTAENFFSMDGSFRKKLSDSIYAKDKNKSISWLANRPQRHEWNLCLVSMGKEANKFPFFAKCGVARLVRELQHDGHNVSFQAV